ncbi:MAG: CBS domain-containing protein [Actinobacteria bacterium]|nr:CBS domain-containing protein [Actinomycetota bacterium]
MKLLRDIQTRHMLTVSPKDTLHHVARMMSDRDVGSAVVVDSEKVAGIVTERDLLRAAGTGLDFESTKVADVMTTDVVAGEPGWDVLRAVRTMTDGGFRHLLVVDADDDPVGIVSVRDLMQTMVTMVQDRTPDSA